MKRLHFIYAVAPLTVALNTLPAMLPGTWRVGIAAVLGLAVWAVTWLRLYANKKLRPEFAILTMLPALLFNTLSGAGAEYLATFSTPAWQNLNFFLWLGAIFVSIRALLPAPTEYKGRLRSDSVFVLMTIVTIVYGLSCWMNTHSTLLNINTLQ